MVLPIKFGLIGPNGSPMGWEAVSGAELRGDDLLIVDTETATITFADVPNRPVPSLFRGFSAPVKVSSSLSEEDQLFLGRHDADPFNRWQALQDVASRLLVDAVRGTAWSTAQSGALAEALAETLASKELDPAFKAHALQLPNEQTIARAIGENVDPDRIHEVRRQLVRDIVARNREGLERVYLTNDSRLAYSPDFQQAGRRAMKNTALAQLVMGEAPGAAQLAKEQYERALNMTDRMSALGTIVLAWTADAESLLADFRTRFTGDPLVLDKWLSLNAQSPDAGTVDRLRAILSAPEFPRNNPNRLRALCATFGMSNPTQFARADGEGFRFLTGFVGDVDGRNPQVAARVLTAFRIWQSFEPKRRAAAETALKALQESGNLSRNTAEILDRTLAG
jgi:aminopeptidase N